MGGWMMIPLWMNGIYGIYDELCMAFISNQIYAFEQYFEDCETQIRRIGDRGTS